MISVAVMGATGSIGDSTLDLIRKHPDKYHLKAITGHNNSDKLIRLAREFKPQTVVITGSDGYQKVSSALAQMPIDVIGSTQGLIDCVQSDVDVIVAGIVGSAGLPSVMAAAHSGKIILLANKESLVVAGELLMDAARKGGATIIPLDSEHNAIYQCLGQQYQTGVKPEGVEKIVLTASGGPFFETSIEQFGQITVEQAVAHPKWDMGAKISVDSATLMNKGLELIEAHWLFAMPANTIEAIVHPQSIVHSLVYFKDASVLAQLGDADMRIPIAFALARAFEIVHSVDMRLTTGAQSLDLIEQQSLTFFKPDTVKFPCLQLAQQAISSGGTAATILNAANEISVAGFLQKQIAFNQIPEINAKLMDETPLQEVSSIEQLIQLDTEIREKTQQYVNQYG